MKNIIKFINDNPVCYLATSINNDPSVRALRIWMADQTGIYFQTSTSKKFYKHLQVNSKTEVCFYSPGDSSGKMLRITGNIEFLDDQNLKKKVLEARPFLKNFAFENIVIFRLAHGQGQFWTMESNIKPQEFINF